MVFNIRAPPRNVRLAAIKSFFRFLEYRQPAALDQVRRVLAIPFKKTDTRLVAYLLREELQALLDAPDPTTRDGIRDRAMLHVAVCAGLRVSELTGLKIDDIEMSSMSMRVIGKGRGNECCRCGSRQPRHCAPGSPFAERSRHPKCSSTPVTLPPRFIQF
ncbi:tyrosine-type recombinase/integrase [Rhizobium laguerreae]|uniref:tyrosine-type recombinase/integrase n=1 Tax=Rhizobium laguerreae TaxID=1076926 RepID=UPI0021B0F3BC|nr:tyrosine-type recombinase/integrase [Rhizobium laguerreae]